VSRLGLGSGGCALVAGTAQELGHLGLHGSLDEQPGAKTGDIFQHLDQITLPSEQGVDLGAEPIGGRYSTGHGRGSSFVSLQASKGTYVRRHLHRCWDTTLEKASVVTVEGETATPERLEVLTGQTVFWAITNTRDITVTDERLIVPIQ